MDSHLKLEIVTPDKIVLTTEADYVGMRGIEGDFGIMPHHIPLLAALDVGCLYYRKAGITEHVFVGGGFVEVLNNHVSVLAESAEQVQDIDCPRALEAKKRAEERLTHKADNPDLDFTRAELALKKALLRLRVAKL